MLGNGHARFGGSRAEKDQHNAGTSPLGRAYSDIAARTSRSRRGFTDLPTAQTAITAWVHTYNHTRPHQALDMATPASLFRPNAQPEPPEADTMLPPISGITAYPSHPIPLSGSRSPC
ncbi:integrase core domain-containing protein [Nocardia wallacei]|uniref:integrase core domain-containing protein n=1 Tax=Nocardia wallacei TaxID=480035 RepID=UPI003CC7CFC0